MPEAGTEAVAPVAAGGSMAPGRLEATLRAARDRGRKLLVPYVTGGLPGWVETLRAVAAAGADAVEVGIPFSDPMIDGPTIQEASAAALVAGATPGSVLAEVRAATAGGGVGVPLAVMTYYNLAFRAGHERFARELAAAGVSGAILPDLNLEEGEGWERDAAAAGVEAVLLAAPVTPDERLAAICERSRGFVYGISLMGVTGERDRLAATAGEMGRRLKACTDKPVLVGIGVSTPEHAVEAAASADGVIVGSALVRRILDGAPPEEAGAFVASLRDALDRG